MNFEVRVVDPATYQQYLDALRRIGPDDPARQAEALQAIGQSAVRHYDAPVQHRPHGAVRVRGASCT